MRCLPASLILLATAILIAVAAPALADSNGRVVDPLAQVGAVAGPLSHALRTVLVAALLFSTIAAFKVPGTGIPEAISVALLAALLVPAFVTGDAQWYEVAAILLGIVLLAVEVFVIPGFGATGVTGALLVLGGIVLAFVPEPTHVRALDLVALRNALAVLVAGGFVGLGAFLTLGRYLPNLPRAHRLILHETNAAPMPTPVWPVPGDVGVASTDLKPGGVAVLADEEGVAHKLNVVSSRGFIRAGDRVVVTQVLGNAVTVRPAAAAEAGAGEVA